MNGRMTPRRTLLTFEEEEGGEKRIVHFQRLPFFHFFHFDLFFLLLTLPCPLFLLFPLYDSSYLRFTVQSFRLLLSTSHITDKPEFPSSNGTSMSIFDVVEGSDDFEIHLPAKGNPPLIHYFWSKDAISLANNKRIHMNSSTLLIRQVTRD